MLSVTRSPLSLKTQGLRQYLRKIVSRVFLALIEQGLTAKKLIELRGIPFRIAEA